MRILKDKKMLIQRTVLKQDVVDQKITVIEETHKTTYLKMLHDLCSAPPVRGWNFENLKELTTRTELLSKLSSGKETLTIEESEYDSLKEALKSSSILFTSVEVLEFLNYLNDLPKPIEKKK